jgi:hypothetical protein
VGRVTVDHATLNDILLNNIKLHKNSNNYSIEITPSNSMINKSVTNQSVRLQGLKTPTGTIL